MIKIGMMIGDRYEILEKIGGDCPDVAKKLLNLAEGFSPLVCREIEFKAQSVGLEKAYDDLLKDLLYEQVPVMVLKQA